MIGRGRERIRRLRNDFPFLALTLAIPALALLGFLAFQFFDRDRPVGSRLLAPSKPKVARAKAAAPPAPRAASRPKRIVLILDDVGYSERELNALATLDARLTFAVIPGTPRARHSAEMLAGRGYEVLCHIPMEPMGYPGIAAGDGAILTSMTDQQIRDQTLAHLRSVPHARGANNHMGSRATQDRRVLNAMMSTLKAEQAYFVDSVTTAGSLAASVAREHGVPSASRAVFLDHENNESTIRRQLAELSAVAEEKGIAVGIAHLYPATVRVLLQEIPRLQARGFRFVSASEAVN